MRTLANPVVLAFDGSADAKLAIATAGQLFSGRALVVHVYATPTPTVTAMPVPGVALAAEPAVDAELEQRAGEQARSVVSEGVDLARAAGFDPQPELVPGDGVHAVWNAIVSVAEQHDASVIVLGHGHMSWLEEKLLGRVDSGVVKHAGRPVLVVPGATE